MCDPLSQEHEAMYEETVDEFVRQGVAFTGYDLTVVTRNREGIKLRHNDVREGIHEMSKLRDLVDFDDWNVTREVIGKGDDGEPLEALIYYPNGYDLSQHDPIGLTASSKSMTPTVSTRPATPTLGTPLGSDDDDEDDSNDVDDFGAQNSDGTYQTNFKGGLFIRTQFLRDAGLAPHDECLIVVTNGSILVCDATQNQPPHINVSKRTVERNGDIRLAKRTLLEANMTGKTFKIENAPNCVKITEA